MYDIVIENLRWKYEAGEEALKGVSLKVRKGEFLGIVGPNGSGKTTLCLCMTGLIPQMVKGRWEGRVIVDGMDVTKTKLRDIVRSVGIVFQDPEVQLLKMTVEDELAFPLENFAVPREEMRKRVEWALKQTRMEEYRMKHPFELSGGQKQRVAIASVLALTPKIIILDEPTSDLDPIGKREVFDTLHRLKGKHTIIVAEHETEELMKYADRLILLKDGKIIHEDRPSRFFYKIDVDSGVHIPQLIMLSRLLGNVRNLTAIRELVKYGSVKHVREISPKRVESEEAVKVSGLKFIYPDGTIAIDGVNLSIRKGEFTALIGPNGSGKTTLCKCIVGLLKPTEGNVKVDGRIGMVFQNPDHQLFCKTVYEECAFGLRRMGLAEEEIKEAVADILKVVGLSGLENVEPFFLTKDKRQRLAIAATLATQPEIIIVDEPTTGQDVRQTRDIMDLLRRLNEKGKTILIVTHDMKVVAKYAGRTIVMKDGRIIADGETRDIFSRFDVLREASILPPQITIFGRKIIPQTTVLTVEEMYELVKVRA